MARIEITKRTAWYTWGYFLGLLILSGIGGIVAYNLLFPWGTSVFAVVIAVCFVLAFFFGIFGAMFIDLKH